MTVKSTKKNSGTRKLILEQNLIERSLNGYRGQKKALSEKMNFFGKTRRKNSLNLCVFSSLFKGISEY